MFDSLSSLIKKIVYTVVIVLGGSYLINNFGGNEASGDGKELNLTEKLGEIVNNFTTKAKEKGIDVTSDLKGITDLVKNADLAQTVDVHSLERIYDDQELTSIMEVNHFPFTDVDALPQKGTFVMSVGDGQEMIFRIELLDHENKKVAGRISYHMKNDSNVDTEWLSYCGRSVYAMYPEIEQIGQPTTNNYFYVSPDGKTLLLFERGFNFEAKYVGNE